MFLCFFFQYLVLFVFELHKNHLKRAIEHDHKFPMDIFVSPDRLLIHPNRELKKYEPQPV